MRKEKDALGEVLVPEDCLWGAQTQRALENFRVGSERFPEELVRALALVKRAAAAVNRDLRLLDERRAEAIIQAADEVIAGKWTEQFPLVVWQSGSGTQFNMNVNEVIAHRAIQILGGSPGGKDPVHPNDQVNLSQSTNDAVPTAIHIAVVLGLRGELLPSLAELTAALEQKAQAFADIVKIGRTHLQDATPLTLGQEFSGYAAQLAQARRGIEAALEHLLELALGGTAVGTGVNCPVGFDTRAVAEIARLTGEPFRPAPNKFAALAGADGLVYASGALKTLAAALMKIANDLRWLASGPRCGIGELLLPANEPGSSIMPGKVNPTQCEMLTMVVCQVYGNDAAIGLAGAQGNFELNVYKPLLGYALLQSVRLLAEAMKSFVDRCVVGILPNRARIEEHLQNSLMLVTALSPHVGYDQAARIALAAWREGKTLREAALALGVVTGEQFDDWVQPHRMTKPGR